MANNRYATAARRKRQEITRKPKKNSPPALLPPPAVPPALQELVDNLNWLFSALRSATTSEIGRAIVDRFTRLATSACIIDGVTLDSEGWAALLNLANGRSFSAMKNRRKISPHKPGQTLMFTARDVLEASARSSGETKEES